MSTRSVSSLATMGAVLASLTCSAFAVTNYIETFNSGANGWQTGALTAPTYHSTGGIANSGYISNTSTFTSAASGSFGAPPLQILFRGNNDVDASGDAFVGNWISDGVLGLSITFRHNYTSPLAFYARLDAGSGRAASVAPTVSGNVAPNTWTTVTIPLSNGNPPFLSYGGGNFSNVFSNLQNVQLGLYVPASTTFTDLKMDIDNVAIVVPEPASLGLIALGGVGALIRRRRA